MVATGHDVFAYSLGYLQVLASGLDSLYQPILFVPFLSSSLREDSFVVVNSYRPAFKVFERI